jgi:hypothetical protein
MITSRHRTNIRSHESVVLYPSVGSLDESEAYWRVWIQGAVFDTGEVNLRKRLMIQLLRRAMDVEATDLNSPLFQDRIRGFLAEPERGKRVLIRCGDKTYRIPRKTKKNGQFSAVLKIPREAVESSISRQKWQPGRGGSSSVLTMQIALGETDFREISGEIHLLHPQGWSVISDIDDTIKDTEVTSRRQLLANTFLREFRDVAGMAELYRDWAGEGASFHYVSSSPWQLFDPLVDFQEELFPDGSFHLRSFRLRDHMLRRLLLRRPGKSVPVRRLVASFPERRFVLVGDSGEKDLDIYSRVTRRYPSQIDRILIREVPERPLTPLRLEKAAKGIPRELLLIFRDPSELPRELQQIALVTC